MQESDLAWLNQVNVELWQDCAPDRFGQISAHEKRRLTDEEWTQLQRLCRSEDKLIFEMHNACFGFGCGIYIGSMRPASYPGVPNEVDWHCFITSEHLPLSVCELRDPKERGADLKDRTFFADGWRAFSPYTHNEQNAKNLKAYGREAPKQKDYYDY